MCDVVDKFLEEAGISAEKIWMGLGFEKQNMVYNTLPTALSRPLAMGAEVFHVPFGYSEELETALDESEKRFYSS